MTNLFRFREKTKGIGHLVLCTLMLSLISCMHDDVEPADSTMLVKVGDQVPSFILTSSDGKELTSSSLSGHVYILNFFDTGCPDCQKEFPVMQQVYDEYEGNVLILNVPRSQTKEEVSVYWKEAAFTMPFYIPQDKKLYYKFATKTIPRTYIVNAEGKVVATYSDAPIADLTSVLHHLQQLLAKGSN